MIAIKCFDFRFSDVEVHEQELRATRSGEPLDIEPKVFLEERIDGVAGLGTSVVCTDRKVACPGISAFLAAAVAWFETQLGLRTLDPLVTRSVETMSVFGDQSCRRLRGATPRPR